MIGVRCRLHELLRLYHISVADFSRATGIPYSTMMRYISGETLPDLTRALTIASTLGMNVEQIWR